MPQDPVWKPNVTVAAIVECDGRFLLVEEHTERGILFNQPAGHLDPGESLAEGAVRETLEETAYTFRPAALVGIYQYRRSPTDVTFLRFAFTGDVTDHESGRQLDEGIIRAVWMSAEEVRANTGRHRSPLVMRCIEDYLAGKRYPLGLLAYYTT